MKQQEQHAPTVEYAGFIVRWVAFTVDNALFALVTIVLLFPFPNFEDALPVGIYRTVITVLIVAATIAMWVRYDGATPGKKLMNIKVVDADTLQGIDVKTGMKRYVGYIMSSVMLLIGFVMVLFSEKHQAFHDKFANTLVVYT